MLLHYIIVLLFGLVTGAFISVCIYRLPREEAIKNPSHCISCNTRLKPFDLLPLLSYMLLKARCRYCGAGISARYPFIELLTAVIFLFLFHKYKITVDFFAAAYLMAILTAVFFIDWDHRIIPDELVVAGLAGGVLLFVYNLFYPVSIFGDRHWWNPLIAIFSGAGFLFVVALIGVMIYRSDEAMGMGDVKIFIPIGMFLGWRMTLIALLLSILTGGTVSLLLVITGIKKRKSTIPFGPFIVIATFITLLWGWPILNWYLGGW